ncbi:MAG: family 10 glycosylhydrolase [Candidatus Omnitrophica bacterium]|nr:family 10 glycosylhydrolase [Candidatus Omnitrophota bacterium]
MRRSRAGRVIGVLLLAAFLPACSPLHAAHQEPMRGLWISCLGDKTVFGGPTAMEEAVAFARDSGFNTLFVQVYRGDKAWFDSELADASPFRQSRSRFNADPLRRLIEQAHGAGLQVHAWINVLTLSQNAEAPLLKKYGEEILTKDQHGRSALKAKPAEPLDSYYDRENQLFLEPGDPRVKEHIVRIVGDLCAKYPALDGIHLDYLRYPAAVPYIPGSRFNPVGLSYGYGEQNVARFKQANTIDPKRVDWHVRDSLVWDNWKRQQVTDLLRAVTTGARTRHPNVRISCAVIPTLDRAYHAAGQDWIRWIEEGIADFVVLMNYSHDSRWVSLASRSALGALGNPEKVAVGLGAYLMSKKPELLREQMRQAVALKSRGIVLFDYSSVTEPSLRQFLNDPS